MEASEEILTLEAVPGVDTRCCCGEKGGYFVVLDLDQWQAEQPHLEGCLLGRQ